MSWREAGYDPQTMRAVLTKAHAPGWEPLHAHGPEPESNVFGKGYWAVWVRCCFIAEAFGWIELWQRGSEGRVQMRRTERGQRILEAWDD